MTGILRALALMMQFMASLNKLCFSSISPTTKKSVFICGYIRSRIKLKRWRVGGVSLSENGKPDV